MNASSSSGATLEEQFIIPPTPHQPGASFKFPKRSFGKTKIVERSFQQCWFAKWPFSHYDEVNDRAFCHMCMVAFKEKKMQVTKKADPAFVSDFYYHTYGTFYLR